MGVILSEALSGDKLMLAVIIIAGLGIGMLVSFPQLAVIVLVLLISFAFINRLLKASSGEVFLALSACSLFGIVAAAATIFFRRMLG